MKKIALFMAIVMSIMTLSFVFASEEDVLLVAPAVEDEIEGETIEDGEATEPVEITAAEDGEIVDGEGEEIAAPANEEPTTNDTPTVISSNVAADDTTNTKSNKTIVGAIIAIVIVVVVIALAALVQKK